MEYTPGAHVDALATTRDGASRGGGFLSRFAFHFARKLSTD
jgi:hypothetical protein